MSCIEADRKAPAIAVRCRHAAVLALLAAVAVLLSACAGSPEASRSLKFDAHSDKAIVVLATSVNHAQDEEIRAGRSLETYWQEYDPATQRLVPGGKTFLTRVNGGAFSEPDYLKPTVAVLEIEPGSYALIGAGFPHQMTTFVRLRPTRLLNDGVGGRQSWHHTIDPRVHIDPEAEVSRGNFLFTVLPGQILYIGHFGFMKWERIDSLRSINHYRDEAAARAALEGYPGISGVMETYDPKKAPQSVSR